VKIYSNCDSVELKVNGQSFGSIKNTNCIFKWLDIRLKDGSNIIEAIATRDGKTFNDRCEWLLALPPAASEPNN
jgi:beta-galactosidase